MSNVSSLPPWQAKLLAALAHEPIGDHPVWGGGTALAACYLHHRTSYDLDFFVGTPLTDVEVGELQQRFRSAGATTVRHAVERNRWLFTLDIPEGEPTKIEYVYYPFPRIKPPQPSPWGVPVESLEDIATNKTFTLYERAEPKDAYDLWVMAKQEGYTLVKLLGWVERKFGSKIDMVFFGGQLLKATEAIEELRPMLSKRVQGLGRKIWSYFEPEINAYLRKKLH